MSLVFQKAVPSAPSARFPIAAKGFVERWGKTLLAEGTECAECPFFPPCRGYFKWPGRDYDCTGIKTLFHTLQQAAEELRGDLAAEPPTTGACSP